MIHRPLINHPPVFGSPYPSRAASYVTLRIRPSSGPVEKYPPIWADVGAIPIKTLDVQIWAFCARAGKPGPLDVVSAAQAPRTLYAGWQGRRVGGTRSPALYASPAVAPDGARGSNARVPAAGLVAGLLALPVPGPERLYCWHEDEAGSGENAWRWRWPSRACWPDAALAVGPAPAGAWRTTTRRQRAWPGDDGRQIWAWRWVSLCARDLLGAAVFARPHVTVTLADMGMTRMMGGTARLGAHMMLRVSPATIPAGRISVVASNLGWRTHELVILPLAAGAAAGQRVPGATARLPRQEAGAKPPIAVAAARAKASGRAR